MSDSDDSPSRLRRVKRLVTRMFLVSVSDHPANGGMTGDQEWDPEQSTEPSETADGRDRDSE